MKKKKFNFKTLLIFCVVLYFVGIVVKQEVNAIRLNKEFVKANNKLQVANQKGEQLKEQLDMSRTNPLKFGEKRARERLGLVKKNETPVIPIPESK